METSHILLNQGLTFLAFATGIMLIVIGGFLVKLLIDLSKLTKNLDDTTTMVKTEIEPTLKELGGVLKSINSIAQNADKKVDSIAKLVENILGTGFSAFNKAKEISGGFIKGLTKGLIALIKIFVTKK